jgi:two-component system sensor histidine kinase VicK
MVSVEDTGIGISEEEKNKIFTKFFRSLRVIKKETIGTGLGLYLAKNIIERHGGQIWFKSEENRGTTFYFTLPLDPSYIPPQ